MSARFAIFSCLVVLLLGTFIIARNSSSDITHQHLATLRRVPQQSPELSDHAAYDFLFRNIVRLREKTSELQAQGRLTRKEYYPLKKDVGISDEHSVALEAIAFACRQQVTEQDEKAKVIIAAFQSRFPGGKVPGGGSPPPPPELKSMWEERKAIVLRARDQLRLALGEDEFLRLDRYAKSHSSISAPVNEANARTATAVARLEVFQ